MNNCRQRRLPAPSDLRRALLLVLLLAPAPDAAFGRPVEKQPLLLQYGSGLLLGTLSGLGGLWLGAALADCNSGEYFCSLGGGLIGGSIGYVGGSALGVQAARRSAPDRGSPAATFLGSTVGFGLGVALTASSGGDLWPTLLALPPAGALLGSYWTRPLTSMIYRPAPWRPPGGPAAQPPMVRIRLAF
ncbi:MAG: hypothetical protein GKR89_15320 [Candidatus Latescibacteria bacterium]|nr:hypothetical protein [Candidatus Latescibacterota bacterium]